MVLAPMSGYTDAAYRIIVAKYGKPDVMYTEFAPADGLCSAGRDNLLNYLWKTEIERPVVAQIYGGNPENFHGSAQLIASLGIDGIDINMGCPAREVESRKGGSALINDRARAREIIEATKAGAGEVPVSIKTRIGYRTSEIESWLACLIETKPAAISFHARTRNDAYEVPARWDAIKDAVELTREIQPQQEVRPLIIGNGDVKSLAEADERAKESGCDGVMVGRGLCGNPWFFNPQVRRDDLLLSEVLDVLLEHTRVFVDLYGDNKPLDRMKKHFKAYLSGFPRISSLRSELMRISTLQQVESAVESASGSLSRLRRG